MFNQQEIEKSTMFLLIDAFIQNHAESNLVLDYERSNILEMAMFYAGFVARQKTDYLVHRTQQPKPLSSFKK